MIAFDVTSCAKAERGGIGGYGRSLIAALGALRPELSVRLALRPNRWLARGHLAGLLPRAPRRLLVDRLVRPLVGPIDLLHSIGVRLPPDRGCARVATLHDLNVFEYPELSDERWRRERQARIRQTVGRADLLVSYSEQGARSLHEQLGVPPERVAVVPCGVDTDVFRRPEPGRLASVLARHRLADRPYLLHVGAFSARKNQQGLLSAFVAARLPAEWVLVLGGPRGPAAERLRGQAVALGLPPDRLRLPGFLAPDELPALLAGAAIFCCASLHEGFGLPVIEAQACGAPVLCSDRGALPETLGEVGVPFDPADAGGFAGAIAGLARDEAHRRELARRGPERVARHFTWRSVAERTLAAHERARELFARRR